MLNLLNNTFVIAAADTTLQNNIVNSLKDALTLIQIAGAAGTAVMIGWNIVTKIIFGDAQEKPEATKNIKTFLFWLAVLFLLATLFKWFFSIIGQNNPGSGVF
jgi:ABC-type multidrug transport system fused ATPase/permease subunit